MHRQSPPEAHVDKTLSALAAANDVGVSANSSWIYCYSTLPHNIERKKAQVAARKTTTQLKLHVSIDFETLNKEQYDALTLGLFSLLCTSLSKEDELIDFKLMTFDSIKKSLAFHAADMRHALKLKEQMEAVRMEAEGKTHVVLDRIIHNMHTDYDLLIFTSKQKLKHHIDLINVSQDQLAQLQQRYRTQKEAANDNQDSPAWREYVELKTLYLKEHAEHLEAAKKLDEHNDHIKKKINAAAQKIQRLRQAREEIINTARSSIIDALYIERLAILDELEKRDHALRREYHNPIVIYLPNDMRAERLIELCLHIQDVLLAEDALTNAAFNTGVDRRLGLYFTGRTETIDPHITTAAGIVDYDGGYIHSNGNHNSELIQLMRQLADDNPLLTQLDQAMRQAAMTKPLTDTQATLFAAKRSPFTKAEAEAAAALPDTPKTTGAQTTPCVFTSTLTPAEQKHILMAEKSEHAASPFLLCSTTDFQGEASKPHSWAHLLHTLGFDDVPKKPAFLQRVALNESLPDGIETTCYALVQPSGDAPLQWIPLDATASSRAAVMHLYERGGRVVPLTAVTSPAGKEALKKLIDELEESKDKTLHHIIVLPNETTYSSAFKHSHVIDVAPDVEEIRAAGGSAYEPETYDGDEGDAYRPPSPRS